jgi:small-conductance mechanosensitive channel
MLLNLIEKLLIFLGRPGVQIQVAAMALVLVLSGLLSRWLWSLTSRRFPSWDEIDLSDRRQVYKRRLLVVVDYLILPILNIIAITIARNLLLTIGAFVGLLTAFMFLFWAFLIYRIFLGVLYVLFPFEDVRRFHLRLFAPLFGLFVAGRILGELTDLTMLGRVVVTTLFGSPITLGALFLATIGLYLWLDAAWGLQDVLYRLITNHTKADPGAVEATLTLARYILIVIGLIIVFSNLNFDTTTIAAITGGLSVGIGFALREVLSNFISGILLLFEGSLHPGDVVDVNGEISVVKRLTIRSTHVQTRNNVEVIIPNQTFFTSAFTTYTGTDRIVRLLVSIGASYNNNPEEVIKILEAVGQAHSEVQTYPKPTAFLTGFGDSSVDFNLAVWINNPTRIMPITSDINRAIWQAFAENKIEIPFPQQDVHLHNSLPQES